MSSTSPVIDLRGTTKEIEDSYLGGGSRDGYKSTLVLLIIFLFDSPRKSLLFSASILEKLQGGHDIDMQQSKSKERPHLRDAAKKIIDKLGTENFRPIVMDHFTYDDMAAFMNSKCKKVLVNKGLAVSWNISKGITRKLRRTRKPKISSLRTARNASNTTNTVAADNTVNSNTIVADRANGIETATDSGVIDISANMHMQTDEAASTTDEKVEVIIPLSTSAYTQIQSSISFLFRECKMSMPQELRNNLSKYIKGSKRMGRKMKQSLALKISEGKKAMTRSVYSFLCRLLMESNKKEHLFAHLFLALDWNLMKRAENVVDCKIDHIWVEDDSIIFQFAKSIITKKRNL